MHRADIVTTAVKLRESVAHIEKREAEIANIEKIRDCFASGDAPKSGLGMWPSDFQDFFHLLTPIKPVVIDELNRQIAVKTAEMEALQMSPQGEIVDPV